MIPQSQPKLHRSEFTLGILAGGSGIRAGRRDKGLMVAQGKTLLERTLEHHGDGFSEVITCCRDNPWFYSRFSSRVMCDLKSGQGPLQGLSALLDATRTQYLAVLPCDQYSLPPDWLERLSGVLSSTVSGVFATDGGTHTPCCVLHRSAQRQITDLLKQNKRSLMALLESEGLEQVEVPGAGMDIDHTQTLHRHPGNVTG
jgi:molybdopterin-guanine dinucleotide biosynthesis protein A